MPIGVIPSAPGGASGGGGVRVAPDADDIACWLLDEPATPWANTGSGGAANMTLGAGAIDAAQAGVVAPNCIIFPSMQVALANSYLTGGAALVADINNFSVSCWHKMTSYPTGGGQALRIVTKPVVGGGAPFVYLMSLLIDQNAAGKILAVECTTTVSSYVYIPTNAYVSPGVWHHFGATWDSATGIVKIYMDGALVGVSPVLVGVLDDGVNGWDLGGSSEDAVNYDRGLIQDVRLANVTRPLSYFQNIYRKAFGLAGA